METPLRRSPEIRVHGNRSPLVPDVKGRGGAAFVGLS